MIPALRQAFNREFTAGEYSAFREHLDRACGTHITFRICETPCFFTRELLDRVVSAGRDLIHQLVGSPAYRAASQNCIPAGFAAPNESAHPLFIQADFGLVRGASGALEPRLVEIQGFASLYAFQAALARAYIEKYARASGLQFLIDFETVEDYRAELRRAIVGSHDPENVVLLEIEPQHQKTLPDFLLTEKMLGVRPVCVTSLRREGKRLFYQRDGKLTPIYRVYNRVIADELIRKRIAMPFQYADDLDLEWAGHPNWFFRISKFSLPFLQGPTVPHSWFLDQLFDSSAEERPRSLPAAVIPSAARNPSSLADASKHARSKVALELPAKLEDWPARLDDYVLKPLYSFAGLGVIVGPTRDELAAIPAARRHEFILQRRMRFEPVIDTPHGPTQAELRVMFIWLDELRAGPLIVRMGRGKMMGVDHNRDLEWVGASAALFPAANS